MKRYKKEEKRGGKIMREKIELREAWEVQLKMKSTKEH